MRKFNITQAPPEQREAIYVLTELHHVPIVQWLAGPFGQAYTDMLDSMGDTMTVIVARNGTISIRKPDHVPPM